MWNCEYSGKFRIPTIAYTSEVSNKISDVNCTLLFYKQYPEMIKYICIVLSSFSYKKKFAQECK